MLLSEFSYISFLFSSDLEYIKLHAVGDRFDDVQSLSETLASFAKYTADFAAKKAIYIGEEMKAFSKAKQIIDDSVWTIENKNAYTFDDLIVFLDTKGQDYLGAIDDTRFDYKDVCDVIPVLDNVMNFWLDELHYKNKARQFKNEEPVLTVAEAPLLSPVEYGKQELNKLPDHPITVSEWATRFKDRTYSADEIVNEVNKIFNIK